MTDEERQQIQSYIIVRYDRPVDEIKKALARQFGHRFTDDDITKELSALYRKIRNGGFVDTDGTEKQRLDAILRALEKATRFAEPKSRLMDQLEVMANLYLRMTNDEDDEPPSYSFAEFKRSVLKKHFFERNKEQGWQQLFVDCNNRGYSQASLNKWKASDVVPPEAMDEIDKLDLSRKIGEKMERWKPEEIEAFEEYVVVANGRFKLSKTHAQIARELTVRFGRNLNENSIKSKFNSYKKNRNGECVVETIDFDHRYTQSQSRQLRQSESS